MAISSVGGTLLWGIYSCRYLFAGKRLIINLTVIPSDGNKCDGSFLTVDGISFSGGNALPWR